MKFRRMAYSIAPINDEMLERLTPRPRTITSALDTLLERARLVGLEDAEQFEDIVSMLAQNKRKIDAL